MEEIYKEYSEKLYNYLFSLSKDENIAEDLLQETFYSAVKNINKFRNESSISTWLYKIAKNKWLDYYKKSQKLDEIHIDEKITSILSNSNLEDEYLQSNNIINICRKIHNMDDTSKEVLYLRIFANFSFKEIATILGKTEEHTRIIFFRAKNKLKEVLNNE